MPLRPRRRRALVALAAALAFVAGACGGGGGDDPETKSEPDDAADETPQFVAQVASYELVAGRPQRFMTGLVANGTGSVVSFGTIDLEFFYLGTKEEPVEPPVAKGTAKATFLPVGDHDAAGDAPREVRPSEGLGVYEARDVTFDTAGFWGVRIVATIDGEEVELDRAFEVIAEPRLPFPGSPAPRTANPTIASAGAESPVVDSRAGPGKPVPDAELHSSTVAEALAAGRPVVVVVSTPVYCVSRFCGPITDRVASLAKMHGDRAAFVHIEVWENFEDKIVNPAALEWIRPKGGGDIQEPWVYLVGGDGIVKERFDNIASDQQLTEAVDRLVGG
ncbi:MAG TPA: hypothetical protein VF230_06845 [Acidimicrobiales bacterium]